MRLTDLAIKRLPTPEKGQKTYFDESVKGFGVRISQGGGKSFIVMFGNSRKLKTLGKVSKLTLSEARRAAMRVLSSPERVLDQQFSGTSTMSFTDAKELFLADCERKNRPRTAKDYKRLLNRHFNYRRKLGEVTRSQIVSTLQNLAPTPSEQHHAFVALRTLFNWCLKQGLLDSSPVANLSLGFTPQERDRVLSNDELKTVYMNAVAHSHPFGHIMRLIILSGQRRGEIAAMEWDWIDTTNKVINFPANIAKNRLAHTIPYSALTQAVFNQVPNTGKYLFGNDRGTYFSGWGKSKARFDKDIEITPYVIHDIRRTYSSTMASLNIPLHVTEKLLNHKTGTISGVAAVYNKHTYQKEMKRAVVTYEKFISKLTTS